MLPRHAFACLPLFLISALPAAATAPVTVTESADTFTLSNGVVTAVISKKTASLNALAVGDKPLLHANAKYGNGYWEQEPAKAPHLITAITIDPTKNGGERAEVSVKGISDGVTPLGAGPGGSTLCDIEIRYTLEEGSSGLYTYAIYTHPAAYPATQIGESRFALKLSDAFDWLSIDAQRNKQMASGADWDKGELLNMKEARRLTTGVHAGEVEHKYDYSAVQSKIPAFGWSDTTDQIGLWCINPSMEYLSGGPTKVELTGHLDNNPGGAPTLLDYWRGTHYGGSVCAIPAGIAWSKVVGPIFLYVNRGGSPTSLWQEALQTAAREADRWPYAWVKSSDYPALAERGVVTGRLQLDDPQVPGSTLGHFSVGLSAPDYEARGGRRGGSIPVSWQNDAAHYEFWSEGATDGRFRIAKIRPGTYTLHAFADGVLGEFARTQVVVTAGGTLDLGNLVWRPVRYGIQEWEIGIPNRSAREFYRGNDYFHWGLYLQYAKDFPHDITYVVGQSDYARDWNFEQVPHVDSDDGRGRATGRSTPWTIQWSAGQARHGQAILRLALVGVSAKSIDVTVNGHAVGAITGLEYNAVINRDGNQGSWVEKDLAFDAALITAGTNTLTLTIPAGGATAGIMYDYLRLEVNSAAPAPK